MRIAICFFGITRNLQPKTLQSIEENLFAPVRRLDPDFVRFGHFNLPGQLANARSKEVGIALTAGDHLKLGCDHLLTTPQEEVDRQTDLSPFKPFGDPWEDQFASMTNLLRQYYSLGQVTELLIHSGLHFDLVIFSRADVLYRNRLRIPALRPQTIYTPGFAEHGGLNDRFALGGEETMIHYGFRGRQAREYVESTGRPLHAESLLKWRVQKLGLRQENLAIRFWRIRANGKPFGLDSHRRHFYHLRAILLSYLRPGKRR